MSFTRVQQPPGGHCSHGLLQWAPSEELEPVDYRPRTRPGSASKQKELSGSNIFGGVPTSVSSNQFANGNDQNNGNFITDRPSVRVAQQPGGASQIFFGDELPLPEGDVRKPVSQAKIQELSGTLEAISVFESPRRPLTAAKVRELNGSNIFGQSTNGDDQRSSVRISTPAGGRSQIVFGDGELQEVTPRKVTEHKVAELNGHNIFEVTEASMSTPEKPMSAAKRREMVGSDIFADASPGDNVSRRQCVGGIRKPPGGGSTLSLT